jgi:pseudouridine-5'-phosphate glycosidase
MLRQGPVQLAPEVERALGAGAAVVALESTIITHGLPHPVNIETALQVEELVRAKGAVPATIAVIGGRLRAGLEDDELRRLAAAKDVQKASRRDLAVLLRKGATAGTTVAATMFIAALAGIRIFATGGTGGVHRGAELTFDISADLGELARSPVAVVSAGVKSILDIAKTAELLESLSVPVIGYRTSDFPAFHSRASGCRVDHRFETVEDIAAVMALHWRLGATSGLLIANPIPEAEALDRTGIEEAIEKAVLEARKKGIAQKDLTPFLLSRLAEITQGKSLRANVALICNNAAVAAEIAVAYAQLQKKKE